jgi:hypothetical protein
LVLASKLATNPDVTIDLLETNKLLNSLRINRQTADPATRTELFDLVQGQITASIHNRIFGGEGNRISITKAVHKRLYKQLRMDPSLDDRAAEYQDIFVTSAPRSTDNRQILAACENLNITDHSGTNIVDSQQLFISMAQVSLIDAYPKQPLKLSCDNENYSMSVEKIRAEPLPRPENYDIQKYVENGEVNVLLTYAFSNETDAKLLAGIISYLGTKGYLLNPVTDIKRGIATFDGFKLAFNKADIYIPAAHLLDLNTFELGTEKSTVMTFTKKFKHKNGTTIKAKVTAFFPEKNSGSMQRLNRSDLAGLLVSRRLSNPTSLFVLTTSCRAGDAVSTWTSAYRESLEADLAAGKIKYLADAKDMIHAIAPEGSFPTSTPSEMLLDFIGPLDAMKIIFEGGTPNDVFTMLGQEIRPDRFIRFIQKIERLVAGKKGKMEPIYFIPKYNFKEPTLLDQKGFEYKLIELD